ncbi:MAG TPA: GNAT family N-acetyltransferase [Gemmatimonadaceae bacterium]|nr:GNAT family N-acetyltransferase [Gemmatimonadaceae bacterium]
MTAAVQIRPARPEDVAAIVRLNNQFADALLMLRRSPQAVALSIQDFVVALAADGELMGCGSLKEYSPSVAEVAAIAVAPEAQGLGVGRAVVQAVERLARKRDVFDVFALTLQPAFFAACGYVHVDRARYPEKIRRDCLGCARRFACDEHCFAKNLHVEMPRPVEASRDQGLSLVDHPPCVTEGGQGVPTLHIAA